MVAAAEVLCDEQCYSLFLGVLVSFGTARCQVKLLSATHPCSEVIASVAFMLVILIKRYLEGGVGA